VVVRGLASPAHQILLHHHSTVIAHGVTPFRRIRGRRLRRGGLVDQELVQVDPESNLKLEYDWRRLRGADAGINQNRNEGGESQSHGASSPSSTSVDPCRLGTAFEV